jgi:hypothetical protein
VLKVLLGVMLKFVEFCAAVEPAKPATARKEIHIWGNTWM